MKSALFSDQRHVFEVPDVSTYPGSWPDFRSSAVSGRWVSGTLTVGRVVVTSRGGDVIGGEAGRGGDIIIGGERSRGGGGGGAADGGQCRGVPSPTAPPPAFQHQVYKVSW